LPEYILVGATPFGNEEARMTDADLDRIEAALDLELQGDFERAWSIIAEELFVRLCLHDYPPEPE
jgi:hypothetical protein